MRRLLCGKLPGAERPSGSPERRGPRLRRLIADDHKGFRQDALAFSQDFDWPERYGALSRFDTIPPSSCSQATRNRSAPVSLAERNGAVRRHQVAERLAAVVQRSRAKIFPVQEEQVEGVEHRILGAMVGQRGSASSAKFDRPMSSITTASPSLTADRRFSFSSSEAMRAVQSCPLRVRIVTLPSATYAETR